MTRDMATSTGEKCTSSLPSIRVSESLEIALLKLASREDRKPSEYIRRVLERHVFGHVVSLGAEEGDDK